MAGEWDRFLQDVIDDCIEGARPGGQWLGHVQHCMNCGRPSLYVSENGGYCNGCNDSAEEKAEMAKRANEAAHRFTDAETAAHLRRLANQPRYDGRERRLFLEEAEKADRRQGVRDRWYAEMDAQRRAK